jgi:hypothetical protein
MTGFIRTLSIPAAAESKAGVVARYLWGMFLIAALVRIAALLVPHTIELGHNATQLYLPTAQRILAGQGFNDAATREFSMTGPGYSYFLASLFLLFGPNLFVVRLVQALMDAGSAVLVFLLAERLAGRKVAILAFIGYTFYPLAIHYTQQINSESVFTLVQMGVVWVVLEAVRRRQARWYLLAGVLFGVAALIRSTPLVLPFLLLPVVAAAGQWKPKAWAQGALVIAVTLSMVLVWGIRNQRVLGEFILLQTNSGSTFCHGADARTWTIDGRLAYHEPIMKSLEPRGIVKPTTGLERDIDKWYWKAGIELYRIKLEQDPLSLVGFFLQKSARIWYASEAGHSGRLLGAIHFPLAALMLLGILARRREIRNLDVVMVGVIGLYVALDILTLPMIRYLAPVMPLILIYASIGLLAIIGSFRSIGACRRG